MDVLASLLSSFSRHAGVFYTGNICVIHDFEHDTQRGHLHPNSSGSVQECGVTGHRYELTQPTLLFLPRPDQHRLAVGAAKLEGEPSSNGTPGGSKAESRDALAVWN